jgi:hypothetical protein
MDIAQAEAKRDTGMARAVDHADRVRADWSLCAAHALHYYCQEHRGEKFLAEDVRAWAEAKMLVSDPPTKRAWGAVIKHGAKMGVIRRVGYAPAKSSNMSPKCQWEAS